jgi:TRAP-type mannitol/chloroaromatic compound transport system substrate-binding protein
VLTAFGKASGEVMQEVYDNGDDITKKICASYFAFRKDIGAWTRISEQAYTNARLLEFKYPEG